MDIKKIFNILLLAISLTTIFVTLISYIIFKFRQAGIGKVKAGKHLLESSFFRRYAPNLEAENIEELERNARKRKKIPFKVRFGFLVAFVFSVIAAVFFFEDYISYRAKVNERIASASEYRVLIKQGLLKSYVFDPTVESVEIAEKISRQTLAQLEFLQKELSKQKFCLFSTKRLQESYSQSHGKALKRWKQFFKRNKLNSVVTSKINNPSCFYIFAHALELSEQQRKNFVKLKRFLVTGDLGSYKNGQKLNGESDLERELSINIFSSEKSKPTIVGSRSPLLLNFSGGKVLNWFPLDTSTDFYLSEKPRELSVVDFNGVFEKQTVNDSFSYQSRFFYTDEKAWTSLDPINVEEADAFFLSVFSLLLERENYAIPVNQELNEVSIALVKDSIENNGLEMIRFLNNVSEEYTLFANSIYYRDYLNHFDEDKNFEAALLEVQGDRLGILELKDQFNYFDKHRLDIEEVMAKHVKGFYGHEERINSVSFNAFTQNKMKYLFGGRKLLSYSPVLTTKDNWFIPRVMPNSNDMDADKLLINQKDFENYLIRTKSEVDAVGGKYILTLSNRTIENPILMEALKNFFKRSFSYSSLSNIVNWLEQRESLDIEIYNDKVGRVLKIRNNNSSKVPDFVIHVRHRSEMKEIKVKELSQNSEKLFRLE